MGETGEMLEPQDKRRQSARYSNRANTSSLFMHHAKKHASHKNLHPTQFPYPTALPRCFALPTRTRKK